MEDIVKEYGMCILAMIGGMAFYTFYKMLISIGPLSDVMKNFMVSLTG